MATATAASRGTGENRLLRWTVHPASFTYRLGQCGEVVHRGFRLGKLTVVTYDVPAPWSGQPKRVQFAQIVGVRLTVGG